MRSKISFVFLVLLFIGLSAGAVDSKYRVIKVISEGWIKGRVTHTLPNLQIPSLEVDRDVKSCGAEDRKIEAVDINDNGALRNTIVYLKEISAGKDFAMRREVPTLTQDKCGFHPHVQLVPPFSSIRIINDDSILHSVHTYQFPFG